MKKRKAKACNFEKHQPGPIRRLSADWSGSCFFYHSAAKMPCLGKNAVESSVTRSFTHLAITSCRGQANRCVQRVTLARTNQPAFGRLVRVKCFLPLYSWNILFMQESWKINVTRSLTLLATTSCRGQPNGWLQRATSGRATPDRIELCQSSEKFKMDYSHFCLKTCNMFNLFNGSEVRHIYKMYV